MGRGVMIYPIEVISGSLTCWSCSRLLPLSRPALYNTSEYKPLIALRENAARTQLLIAEGSST